MYSYIPIFKEKYQDYYTNTIQFKDPLNLLDFICDFIDAGLIPLNADIEFLNF